MRATEDHATNLSALMEAIGLALDGGTFRIPDDVGATARRIEPERRRRL